MQHYIASGARQAADLASSTCEEKDEGRRDFAPLLRSVIFAMPKKADAAIDIIPGVAGDGGLCSLFVEVLAEKVPGSSPSPSDEIGDAYDLRTSQKRILIDIMSMPLYQAIQNILVDILNCPSAMRIERFEVLLHSKCTFLTLILLLVQTR